MVAGSQCVIISSSLRLTIWEIDTAPYRSRWQLQRAEEVRLALAPFIPLTEVVLPLSLTAVLDIVY